MSKYFLIILFFLSFGTVFTNAQEDLDAAQKKQLRDEIQYLGRNLPEFKAFFDSLNVMKPKIDSIQRIIRVQNQDIITTEQKVSDLRLRVNELEAELEKLRNRKPGRSRNIYFRLQIAAFENPSALTKFLERYPKFIKFETHNEDRKYTFVGKFNHYWEVKQIEKLLLGTGVQVFVVPYEDGKRIDIKSVPQEYL